MTKGGIFFLCATIFGISGFGGVVCGNIFTARKMRNIIAAKEEEIEFLKKYYKKKYSKEIEEKTEEKEPEKEEDPEPEVKESDEPTIEDIVRNYSPEEDPQEPYIITADEYGLFTDPDYISANLYWRGDATLVDENGDLVDIDYTIGRSALDELNKRKYDDPYIYVRNPVLKIDYEVVWDDFLTPRNKGQDHSKKDW